MLHDVVNLLIMLRRIIGWYFEESDHSPEFLKTGQIDYICHELLEKHFSLRQRLKSFANIGDNSGDKFFKTTTGIWSGPVAFDDSRL